MKLDSTIVNFFKIFATLMVFCCHSVIVASECFNPHGLIYLFNTPAWGGVDVSDNQRIPCFVWL